MNKYKYLLFDNDGTLMDFTRAQKVAFTAAYNRSSCFTNQPYSPKFHACYEICNHRWWEKLERGECTKDELQTRRFADFLHETGLEGDAAEWNRLYMEELGKGTFLIDGALEVVRALSARYQIYIITNGVAETQHRRLDACAFKPFIDAVFVSEEAGFAKPSEKYFTYVLEKGGISDKRQCLVIGDSLSSDILGANNAGIDCMWYNPASEPSHGLRVNYEIRTLQDILSLL